jgi:hypothetical protein
LAGGVHAAAAWQLPTLIEDPEIGAQQTEPAAQVTLPQTMPAYSVAGSTQARATRSQTFGATQSLLDTHPGLHELLARSQ